MEPPRPSESFVTRFQQLTSGSAKRRVDLELRALDIGLSAFFLIVTLPLTVPIAALMLVTDGLPIFYRGERIGRGGRIFTMVKYRTLRRGAEQRLGAHLGGSSSSGRVTSFRRSAGGCARRSSTSCRNSGMCCAAR